jgi:filamentous hemagglutinin family protein
MCFQGREPRPRIARFASVAHRLALIAALASFVPVSRANPTGGVVASGNAIITTAPGVVTVTQQTNTAVINWQTFSINNGETTKFVDPSSSSATLNRVLGGQMSIINGTLTSNGQIYLLNGNGILIGPDGVVNTAGFTASTRDLSDADFTSGNLHFLGSGSGGVTNLGTISAIGGDAILIGKAVDNAGTIHASGHVGLAAADDVLISQSGLEHVFVRSSPGATAAPGQTGVNNSGSIVGAAAELRAANGNIYALATNNSGIIRATGVANQGGHIWLVAAGNLGTTQNTGTLDARGPGGQGGTVETSGDQVVAHGTVLTGAGGSWLIDPSNITIDGPTAATIETSLNGGSTVTEDSSTGTGGTGAITVAAPITWTGTGTLDLFAYSSLTINSAITGNAGTLNVKSANGGTGTITDPTSAISVGTFALQGGSWVQNTATLPGFAATSFSVAGGSFLRVTAGSGVASDPYQVTDVYGLQGIGSSGTFEAADWRVSAAIDASPTATWNAGAGFVPIANFTGTFNGNGETISGLTINTPAATNVGLFGQVGAAGTVTDVILTGASVTGLSNVGALIGSNAGAVETTSVGGTVSGTNSSSSTGIGGMIGTNSGSVGSSFSGTTVTGYNDAGGLVGTNTGSLISSYATGNTGSFLNPSVSGANLGGLVGENNGGTLTLDYVTGNTNAPDTAAVGGLVGLNTGAAAVITEGQARNSTVTGYSQVGGLVGSNTSTNSAGSIVGSKFLTGAGSVVGTIDVGGLVGSNTGLITQSSVATTGSVHGQDNTAAAGDIGGFVGSNSGTITDSFALITVGEATGTTDAAFLGGFAGINLSGGVFTSVYATGAVSGFQFLGGLVGENDGALGIQSTASGNVTGTGSNVGGLVGSNTGTIATQSFATGNVSGLNFVGGLIGINTSGTTFTIVYAKGTVTGTSHVGGLVGSNSSGTFTASSASGNVTGSGTAVGGLMGFNGGLLTLDTASGNVTAPAASDVGGLVGDNAGSIHSGTAGSSSNASGNVSGGTAVGGLVGLNEAAGVVGDATSTVEALADYTQATGNVTGLTRVGGLIGDNAGSATQTTASGAVTGNSGSASFIGGLIGRNETTGTISTAFAIGTTYGNGTAATNGADTDTAIGGLVGGNLGSITLSYATGAVVGDGSTGGLVGLDNAAGAVVQTSYSIGNVTGLAATGGLVGLNTAGNVMQSYSSSAVSGTTSVGGLVGLNSDRVQQDYAIGTVAGTTDVGGLVGQNTSTVSQAYATGAVTGGTSGGLIGLNSGSIANTFWDVDSTGEGATGVGSGSATGATGVTSTSGSTAFAAATYAGLGTSSSVAGGASTIVQLTSGSTEWYMFAGATRPFLAWEAPINNPTIGGAHVIYTAHQLQLVAADLGASYVLGKGIDLSATQHASDLWNTTTGFVPIGDATTPFTGALSGATFGITNLYINTPANNYVGLFGDSSGTLGGISVSGSVTGHNDVGLLAGLSSGGISGARASGTATGTAEVGGLVGENDSTVQSSAVAVAVTGGTDVGGAVGYNTGMLKYSYATGSVTGSGGSQSNLGGLAGASTDAVTVAYATGTVTGSATSTNVGGAVGGEGSGTIDQVYATGAVTGGTSVGGLVGDAPGSVSQSYATGTVDVLTGTGGGLVGSLEGNLTYSYASGVVTTADASTTGGLVGKIFTGATYSNLFWDHTKFATVFGVDQTAGVGATDLHGDTIDANTATYAGLDSGGTPGFSAGYLSSNLVYASSDSVWRAQKGAEFPFLTQLSTQVSGTAYTSETHATAATGATVTFDSGSNTLATTTSDGTGQFDFLFAADDGLFNYLPHTNQTLRVSDGAANADSVAAKLFNGNGVPDLLADLFGADTWGSTVRVVSSGLTNQLLATAGSSFVSNAGGNAFGGTNLTISENFDVGATAGSYSVTGDITAEGDFTLDSPASVPDSYDHPVTLQAASGGTTSTPAFTINNGDGLSSNAANRAIIVESDGNFVNNEATAANAFSTPNGTFIVYSTNPTGSGQAVEDADGGLNELHLYGTDYTQTPAYLLSPGLNYEIFKYVPVLTLTAVAGPTATTNLQYGDATPALSYIVSGLLPGDTVTAGQTFNQVLSNQPGEMTTYARYSAQGTYPVSFITTTLPTSLIGYTLNFVSGSIVVGVNTSDAVTLAVSGYQYFGYIGGGPNFTETLVSESQPSMPVANDPNFHPTFTTSVGQFANVNWVGGVNTNYNNTISLLASSVSNYSNVTFTVNDNGFLVKPANLTVTASGTSIYGETIATPSLTSNSTSAAGTIYDNSGTGSTVTLASQGYTTGATGLTPASHAGTTSFTVSGPSGTTTAGDLENYNVTVNPGSYVITPRPLVIDGSMNEPYVYDGTPGETTFGATDYTVGATGTGTGLINGDTITGLMGRVSATNPNVGHYDYTVGTLGTTDANPGDYAITFNNLGFGLNITPRPITIGTLQDATKVYGTADPAYTFAGGYFDLTGGTTLAAGDNFTTTGSLARTAGETVNGGTAYAFTGAGTVGITNGSASTTSDYTVTFNNTAGYGLVITPATLTVTANSQTKTYDGTDYSGGNGVTYAGFKFTDGAGSLGGTLAYSGTSQGAHDAGTYVITPGGYTSGNYTFDYVNGMLTVNKAALTVTADDQSKTYGGTDPTLTYTPSGTLGVGDTYSVISGVTLSTATGAAATAGTHTITATGGTATNYTITDVNGTLTVGQAPLTATADDTTTTYGTAPTLTDTISGTLYYGDTAAVVSGVGLATASGAAATAGTHTITATGGTAANYAVTDVNGTLTVNKAPLTVTADDQTTTYGTNATLTDTVSGTLYYGDTASVVSGVGLATTTGSAATVGSYAITATGGTASNYTITDVNGTLTVNKAPLTVTADDQSKTYGGADPTLTYTPSGTLYYGDGYGVISGVGLSTTTGALATAGTHPIVATGGTASNYAITDVDGTLTVAKAALTVTPTNTSTVYGTAPAPGIVVGGTLYYGDTPSVVSGVTLTTTFGTDPGVGTYSATPIGGTAANYTITDLGITTLTVTPAPLYATAANESKIYGGVDPTLSFTLSGTLYYGDTYAVVSGVQVSAPTGAAATAGTHPITVTGGTAANYQIFDINGLLTVSKAPLTVTADNQSKTYGGADPTLTYTPSGTLYYGDGYGVIGGVTLTAPTGSAATAGTHPITATGGTAANYSITDVDGTLTVAKADLTVTADNQSKVYGGADPSLTYTLTGLQYADTSSVLSGLTLATTTGAAATAGTHPITVTGGTAGNYNVTDVNGLLSVTPAPLTITANPESKLAGTTFTFLGTEFTVSGLVGSDTVTQVTLTSPATVSSAAPATYPILYTTGSAVGTGLGNYTITFVGAPFQVLPGSYSGLPISWAIRSEVAELIGTLFDPSYGERMSYRLQVPGKHHRVTPTGLSGIGTASSLVDVRIGLENIYSLDRFQAYRH